MKEAHTETIAVDEQGDGSRLDRFLAEHFDDCSRAFLQRLIRDGYVAVNDSECRSVKHHIKRGDTIRLFFPEESGEDQPAGEDIALDVLFEDDSLVVINKASGLVVHPAAGNNRGTLVNALIGRDAKFAEQDWGDEAEVLLRPGIVHRLDKDTSGCLVIAKNPEVRKYLSKMFTFRQVEKTYYAITYGLPRETQGEINTLISRHPVNRKKMAVVEEDGRKAITRYHVEETTEFDGIQLGFLRVNIITGRTHQIRVHLAHLRCPVLGDTVYGGHQKLAAPRQMLHAGRLKFKHPVTGESLGIEAPLPDDFERVYQEYFHAGL